MALFPVDWRLCGSRANTRRPVEIHQLKLKPADFFTSNPALNMPTDRNNASVLVGCCEKPDGQA